MTTTEIINIIENAREGKLDERVIEFKRTDNITSSAFILVCVNGVSIKIDVTDSIFKKGGAICQNTPL